MSTDAVVSTSTDPLAPPAQRSGSFVRHARLISGLTLISRILGMAREAVSAHYFGAGIVSSAFTVAFTVPNLFRKLFGEGALSAAFIPLYAQALKSDGTHDGQDSAAFAAAGFNLLCLILVALTLIGEGIIVALILADPAMRADRLLTLKLTAIMLPYVLLICGTAFLSAVLQVHRRFGLPAATPIVLNLIHIVVIVVGARLLSLSAHAAETPHLVARQTILAYWLGAFVLVAGGLQIALLWRPLKQVGFVFRRTRQLWTPPIRRMIRLSIPVALGAGVLQISVLMDKGLSLMLQQGPNSTHFTILGHVLRYPMELGAPARLNWAQFLYQFPLGVFAIALATAIFPALSADAQDRPRFTAALRQGIELTLFEGLPAGIGLMLVADPAVRLLFQHGQITPHDSVLIGRSVLFYSAALWAFSLQQILNRGYYALHDTFTPLVLSILTLAVNLLVELPLIWTSLGESGMAAGTAVSFTLQAIVMLWLLNRKTGGLDLKKIAPSTLKMLLAAAAMTVACLLLRRLPFYPHAHTRPAWTLQLLLTIATGALTYLGTCALLGLDHTRHLLPRRVGSTSRTV
jgi:putative peptidoglycan lipid II flippase